MRLTKTAARFYCASILVIAALIGSAHGDTKMDRDIGGVPIPVDASPLPVDATASPFAGTWIGQWGGSLRTALIVEAINDNGDAKVVYGVARNPQAGFEATWFRSDARIVDNVMIVAGSNSPMTFSLSETGKLKAVYGDGYSFGILTRQSNDILTQPVEKIAWNSGVSEFLKTDLVEDGQPVDLEVVVFRPAGDGPFPLAVINHGSTGSGNNSAAFTETWTNQWLADVLNERGWIVAFPQRRGRGRSDGLYDEGFAVDRSDGYSCEASRTLPGADRALADVAAAVKALRQRADVNDEPILIAGNSRGGILSVAYAGLHPSQTKAVINFVGGWIGDLCHTAEEVNQTLFKKGAVFPGKTLWLYGEDDVFYSMDHSRRNFEAFRQAGGKGSFFDVAVAGENNGHWVMWIPPVWEDYVSGYLDEMDG